MRVDIFSMYVCVCACVFFAKYHLHRHSCLGVRSGGGIWAVV